MARAQNALELTMTQCLSVVGPCVASAPVKTSRWQSASFFTINDQSMRKYAALMNWICLSHMVPTQMMMFYHVTLGIVIFRSFFWPNRTGSIMHNTDIDRFMAVQRSVAFLTLLLCRQALFIPAKTKQQETFGKNLVSYLAAYLPSTWNIIG